MRSLAASHSGRMARLAIVATLVALAGCAGARKAALREDAPDRADVRPAFAEVSPSPEADSSSAVTAPLPIDPAVAREQQRQLKEQVHAHVAQRMTHAAPATHNKVAKTVLKESSAAGVDPLLVLALIHVESSFNPGARSRAGALGLMQVRVPTLREQLKRPRARRRDALNPQTNVQAGVRYFRRLLDTFDGATDLALMAYNAGPGRIQRLLARGSIPERFQAYSRKVKEEVDRLRSALHLRFRTAPLPDGTIADRQG
jgi:soluble lytic murein transglycosylase-like protein